MSKFMVNVALHESDAAETFERLAAEMCKRGFARELNGKKSAYQLPQGNYLFIGDLSAADVRQRAVAAAEMIGQPFGVMVAKVDGWSVMGLKRVPARQAGGSASGA
jgi:hypothetical protein